MIIQPLNIDWENATENSGVRMNIPVTLSANWNDIQPMFRRITEVMMVLLGLLAAIITFPSSRTWKIPGANSGIYGTLCKNAVPVSFSVSGVTNICFQTRCRKSTVRIFEFATARFAITSESIFSVRAFAEIGNRLDLLALRTLFGYNCVRHFRSLLTRLLEPVLGYTPNIGLFYCITL